MSRRPHCFCGSTNPTDWLVDEVGEPVAKVCDDCRERVAFAYQCEACEDEDDEPEEDQYDLDRDRELLELADVDAADDQEEDDSWD